MTHIEFADGTNRDVEIHEANGDWQALYLDGVLHSQGHDVTGILLHMLGIQIRYDSGFLRGGNGGSTNNTAPTIRDLEQWVSERERARQLAEELRNDANAKIAEASKLKLEYGF